MEYIKNTNNQVDSKYVQAASHSILQSIYDKIPLGPFMKPVVLISLVGLLGYFSINKFVNDIYEYVILGISDYLHEKGTIIQNTFSSGMNTAIRTVDRILPIWSYRYSKQKEIDNNNANIANTYMKMFIELVQSHSNDQALITENLDYLVFSDDWHGFINVCQETYAKSEREMKMCVQNLYQFSHDAKVLIQGSDDYQKIVSPKVFEFIAHNKGKTVDEICEAYKIDLENIIWTKPDQDAYYEVMNQHFLVDDMKYLETQYIDHEGLKKLYPYIDAQTAFSKNITSPVEYQLNYLNNRVMNEKELSEPSYQSKKNVTQNVGTASTPQNTEDSRNPYLDKYNETAATVSQFKPSSKHVEYVMNNKWVSDDGISSDDILRVNDTNSYTPLLNETMNSLNETMNGLNNNTIPITTPSAYNSFINTAAPYLPQILSLLLTGFVGKRLYNAYHQPKYTLPVKNTDVQQDKDTKSEEPENPENDDDIEKNKQSQQKSSSLWNYLPFGNRS